MKKSKRQAVSPSRDLIYVKAWCNFCEGLQFFSLKSRKCEKCQAPRPEQSPLDLIESATKEANE